MKKFNLMTVLGLMAFGLFSFTSNSDSEMVNYTVIQHEGFNITVHDTTVDISTGFTIEDYLTELGLNTGEVEIIDTSNSESQFVNSDTEIWFFNSETNENGSSTFEMNIQDGNQEGTQIIMIEESEEMTLEEGTEEQIVMIKKMIISDDPNAMEMDDEIVTITIDGDTEGEATEMNVRVEMEVDEEGNEVMHMWVNGEEVDPNTFDGNINIQHSGPPLGTTMFVGEGEMGDENNFILAIISSSDDSNKSAVTPDSSIKDIKLISTNENTFNLTFTNDKKGNTEIKVYDINGRVVFEDDLGQFSGVYSGEISLPSVSKGTYILNIIQDGVPAVKKMIVK